MVTVRKDLKVFKITLITRSLLQTYAISVFSIALVFKGVKKKNLLSRNSLQGIIAS